MSASLIVVGAGGFGRETLEVVAAVAAEEPGQFALRGVVDDALSPVNAQRLIVRGVSYLGRVLEVPIAAPRECWFVVGIANSAVRRRINRVLVTKGYSPAVLVHPAATVGVDVRLGQGSIICAGARLTTNIVTGDHVHVHVNATIGHDSQLADYVSLYPQSAVSGDCLIQEGVTVGASATILQGLRVGPGAFVGAGAVVVRDIAPGLTVKGVPAK